MITAVRDPRVSPVGRLRALPEVAVGILIGLVLAVVSAHIPVRSGGRPLDALGYTLLVLAGLAMGVCRRWPRGTALFVTAVLCVVVARDYPNGPVWLTGLVALGVLSWRTDRRTAIAGAIVLLVALTVTATSVGGMSAVVSLIYVGWTAAAVFLGEALRSHRSYLSGVARFAERSRADETARRVAEERLRIARDLHDSVAHAMATINVQAGAAVHVLERKPEAAGAALHAIQRASAEVLDELGSMLAVLREGTDHAERAPAPTLGDLERLVASAGPSGLEVDLRSTGGIADVPAALGTAAYRIVQESLTNVLRHSTARCVCVRVEIGPPGVLCVEIHDPGPARAQGTAGSGVGIRGMSERVIATGGRLDAGPLPDGGFLVRAAWGEPA